MPDKRRAQKPPSQPTDDEAAVRFRPVFGVSPRTYVPVAYGALLAVVLFFVLVYPGLRHNGTRITFTSTPPGASVVVDGVRVGATPVTAFVEKGSPTVEVRKPYFEESRSVIDVGGRLFASLLFPRRETRAFSLELADSSALLSDASLRFSRWSLVGRPSAQYQFPLVVAPAIEDLVSSGKDLSTREIDQFLLSAAASTRSDVQLRDIARATALSRGAGGVFGSRRLVDTLRAFADVAEGRPASVLWFAGATSEVPGYAEYRDSGFFAEALESYTTELIAQTLRTDSAASRVDPAYLSVAGVEFAFVPGGTFVFGGPGADSTGIDPFAVPVVQEVDGLYMMRHEVTVELYRRFVASVPEFAPSARDDLVADGLADSGYLAPFDRLDYLETAGAGQPVVAVSYAAAAAFADWFEGVLPRELDGYDVRLPTESEWEWAATLNSQDPAGAWFHEDAVERTDGEADRAGPRPVTDSEYGRLGIADLLGNVWEWCADWYRPAAYPFLRPGAAEQEFRDYPTAMRVVRGGGWANSRDAMGPATRGGQFPDWCTPYLGFRVVLVRRNG